MTAETFAEAHVLVYLLGAGASHPVMPLARDVSGRMIHWGKTIRQYIDEYSTAAKRDSLLQMSDELEHWGVEGAAHYSIDTLAKKLYLNRKPNELWRLKAAMSAFFMIEQATTRAEPRYDSFFAAILERPEDPPALPPNVWLLTWNYDRQLERAYHAYCQDASLVQDNITFCKRVVRLNGLLGRAIDKGTGDEYNLSLAEDKVRAYERIAEEYWQLRSKQPTITFAFEKNEELDPKLKPLSAKSCTVVIVGYSFPFFNRKYDGQVLNCMGSIDRIYLQVLPGNATSIERRIKTLRPEVTIELIDDRDQFFVPYGML